MGTLYTQFDGRYARLVRVMNDGLSHVIAPWRRATLADAKRMARTYGATLQHVSEEG